MKPAVWRALALVCIAAAIGFALYQPTLPQADDFGLTFVVAKSNPADVVVTEVRAGSQAALAHIRAGDTIAYGETALQRASAVYALPGTRVPVTVNETRRAVLTARRMPPVADWSVTVVRLAFLLVAALLAWRRPDDTGTRWLVFFLWCYGLAIGLANGLLPAPVLSLGLQISDGVLFMLGTAGAAGFAANFPARATDGTARGLVLAAQTMAIAIACATAFGEWLPQSGATISVLNLAIIAGFALVSMLVIAAFVVTYVHGAANERQRRRWVFLIVGFALCGLIADVLGTTIHGSVVPWLDELALVPLALLPVGLAYVILRHRVIDVGFVLNRAVVYTAVSIVVVGIFVLLETLLGKYVESASHVESTAVQLGVALVVGFSIRFVHARVDRFVDNVLFRERHLAEAAIREFAHEAPYITDDAVLLSRCVTVVERHANAAGAGVWVAKGTSYYPAASTFAVAPEVDENDPAVLAMRARRANVHVRDRASGLPGFLAFPMIVRGELLGILVCGQKRDDETYAPDEEDALASLAMSVGHALDAIEIRELRRRLEALTATGGGQPAF